MNLIPREFTEAAVSGNRALATIEREVSALGPEARGAVVDLRQSLAVITRLADSAEDLILDADVLVESLPEQFREWGKAVLALADHFMRVGTRASNAAQTAEKSAQEMQGLVADIRREGLHITIPKA